MLAADVGDRLRAMILLTGEIVKDISAAITRVVVWMAYELKTTIIINGMRMLLASVPLMLVVIVGDRRHRLRCYHLQPVCRAWIHQAGIVVQVQIVHIMQRCGA
jgi:hypothetical protein